MALNDGWTAVAINEDGRAQRGQFSDGEQVFVVPGEGMAPENETVRAMSLDQALTVAADKGHTSFTGFSERDQKVFSYELSDGTWSRDAGESAEVYADKIAQKYELNIIEEAREPVRAVEAPTAERDDPAQVRAENGEPVIDGADFSRRTASQRERDREKIANAADHQRVELENASATVEDRKDKAKTSARTGEVPSLDDVKYAEKDKEHRASLLEQIHADYRAAGSTFYYKDTPNKVAFRDKGDKIATASNDERVAFAMASMAEAKGWKAINISGHPDFRREVWMEASLRGIQVNGYTPREADIKALTERRERMMRNTIEKAPEKEQQSAPRTKGPEKASAGVAPEVVAAKAADVVPGKEAPIATSATKETPAPTAEPKGVVGKLVGHGVAPYEFNKDNSPSYYVRVKTDAGEKTMWGKDLARAVDESGVKKGDDIKVMHKGSEAVTVNETKRDEQGRVIGTEAIDTKRNAWAIEKTDRQVVAEAVAAKIVAERVPPGMQQQVMAEIQKGIEQRAAAGKLPSIGIYDKEAPKTVTDRQGPQVERNAERTR